MTEEMSSYEREQLLRRIDEARFQLLEPKDVRTKPLYDASVSIHIDNSSEEEQENLRNFASSVGYGQNSINGTLTASALSNDPPERVKRLETTLELERIDSYERLFNKFELSIGAKFPAWGGVGGAKAKFVRTYELESRSVFMLIKMKHILEEVRLRTPTLSAVAKEMLEKKTSSAFIKTFGDEFISRVQIGGELYAIVKFFSQNVDDKSYLEAKIDYEAGIYNAQAEGKSIIEKFQEFETLSINLLQRGTSTKLPEHSKLLQYVQDFPTLINSTGGSEVSFQTSPYTAAINTSSKDTPDLASQKANLYKLMQDFDNLSDWRNSYKHINKYYWMYASSERLKEWSSAAAEGAEIGNADSRSIPTRSEVVDHSERNDVIIRNVIAENNKKIKLAEDFIEKVEEEANNFQLNPVDHKLVRPKIDSQDFLPIPSLKTNLTYPTKLVVAGNPITKISIDFEYSVPDLSLRFMVAWVTKLRGFSAAPIVKQGAWVKAGASLQSYAGGFTGFRCELLGLRKDRCNVMYSATFSNGSMESTNDGRIVGDWNINHTNPKRRIAALSVTVISKL